VSLTDSKRALAPRPTIVTLYLRHFFPWQAFRFVLINIRMTFMILKSHGSTIPPVKTIGKKAE